MPCTCKKNKIASAFKQQKGFAKQSILPVSGEWICNVQEVCKTGTSFSGNLKIKS
jgi:hypothetical protein